MRRLVFLLVLVLTQQVRAKSSITVHDVNAVLNKLVDLDENAARPDEIEIKNQNMASSKDPDKDNSQDPFLPTVSDRLTNERTFVALQKLQVFYNEPDVNKEDISSKERSHAASVFLESIFYTRVMQNAWLFLGKAGLVSMDAVTFLQELKDLWFTEFSRKTAVGSSGFETVFVGEKDGTSVIGLDNWYRFYLLEKAKEVNYLGWFQPSARPVQYLVSFTWGKELAFKDSLLIGSSPEFEVAAATICALSKVQTCSFAKEGEGVSITVATATSADGKLVISGVSYAPGSYVVPTTQKPDGTTPSPVGLQKLVDDMRAADVDKPTDYRLDWGNTLSGGDSSPNPLYTYVNETLFERPVYKTLIDVFANNVYLPDVCDEEKALTVGSERYTYLKNMVDVFTNTTVFQLAFKYLKDNHHVTDWESFEKTLWSYWFGTYSRCNGALGSSGFEHVFPGEWKGNTIGGQHCWVKYYRLEKAGKIEYNGYYSHNEDLTGVVQYSWEGHFKNKGGFNTGTSPAFDFTLFTVCALTKSGGNNCHFKIDGYPMGVTSYVQKCGNGRDNCIGTAYPTSSASEPTSGPATTKDPVAPGSLQDLVDDMRAADVDKPTDYRLDWGNTLSGGDSSPNPLYTYVNETLFERPVYKTLIDVFANNVYLPDVCAEEKALTVGSVRYTYLKNMVDVFTNTTVFQLAFKYLKDNHHVTDWESFEKTLWSYWFGTYSRCNGALGSSGFEHVFPGEWKGSEIGGQHCWVKYYRLEKAGKIEYNGYYSHNEELTGVVQYSWEGHFKRKGGFNTGTSPAFDFTLFTVCALTKSGGNNCHFKIDGYPMGVTSYVQKCGNGQDNCIGTAYPTS